MSWLDQPGLPAGSAPGVRIGRAFVPGINNRGKHIVGPRVAREPGDWLLLNNKAAARLVPCIDCPADIGENCGDNLPKPHRSRLHRGRAEARRIHDWVSRCEH